MKFIIFLSIFLLAMSVNCALGCICTADYTPVCATNRVTYSNKCRMTCAGAKLLHPGQCGGNV